MATGAAIPHYGSPFCLSRFAFCVYRAFSVARSQEFEWGGSHHDRAILRPRRLAFVPSPSRSRIYPTSANLRCRTRASPSSVRERAQWCAHQFEWVRGFPWVPLTHHRRWQHRAALSRKGRGHNDDHRARGSRELAADSHLTMSNSPTRSRARIAASGLCLFASLTPSRGGRSAESRSGARRNTRGTRHDAACQAPSEAPCVP
jgi:hypothetical protein